MMGDVLKEDYEQENKIEVEKFLEYVMSEIKYPVEDYYFAIELLKKNYSRYEDVRMAILGAYLSSTWYRADENEFLSYLEKHLSTANNQDKAIIYYLQAYDIYMRYDKEYPLEYEALLRKSISFSNRFVYNYVRLSEIEKGKRAKELLRCARNNVEHIWAEADLLKVTNDNAYKYEEFIDEFVLGVDISKSQYEILFKR